MLPSEIELLDAKDLCRRKSHNQFTGQYCLLGHCSKHGDSGHDDLEDSVRKVIQSELQYSASCRISKFNDDTKHPKKLLARVWNRAMYLLGYTEGNTEKKALKPLTKKEG